MATWAAATPGVPATVARDLHQAHRVVVGPAAQLHVGRHAALRPVGSWSVRRWCRRHRHPTAQSSADAGDRVGPRGVADGEHGGKGAAHGIRPSPATAASTRVTTARGVAVGGGVEEGGGDGGGGVRAGRARHPRGRRPVPSAWATSSAPASASSPARREPGPAPDQPRHGRPDSRCSGGCLATVCAPDREHAARMPSASHPLVRRRARAHRSARVGCSGGCPGDRLGTRLAGAATAADAGGAPGAGGHDVEARQRHAARTDRTTSPVTTPRRRATSRGDP